MPGLDINQLFLGGLRNAALLACWSVLPVLCIGFVRQIIVARRVSTDFSLRALESIELDRATLLYARASNNFREIICLGDDIGESWRSRHRRRAEIRHQYRKELEDLTAYADHLRALIVRIRRKPLHRFRSWAHVISSRFAVSYALVVYVAIASLLLGPVYLSKHMAWVEHLTSNAETLLIWRAFHDPLLFANGLASGIAAIVTPAFYLLRRAGLHIEERAQIKMLKEFASNGPGRSIFRQQSSSKTDKDTPRHEPIFDEPTRATWYSVLGVSPSATIDEIKEAYRLRIRQNHPDLVQGMATIFRKLAEDETKKLNAAYEDALTTVARAQA